MFKKIIILISVVIVVFLGGCTSNNAVDNVDEFSEGLSEKLIRFHVLANSDTEEDQQLKQRLKDEVLTYLMPKLKEAKSIEESRGILNENNEDIIALAENFIKEQGYSYKIDTELSHENFPAKRYGNIVLPQGNYEAYRIIIGDGEGQNWWCVMFPPLCFVDVTKGEIEGQQTEEEMAKYLSSEEYNLVKGEADIKDIKLEFKLFELIKNLFTKEG